MTKYRSKQARKCSEEGCNRIIRHWNKSGLCHNHSKISQKKKNHKLWKENHKCFDCPSKVEPVITYPVGYTLPPIKEYPIRCYECRKRISLTLKIKGNKEKKQLVSSSYFPPTISARLKRFRDKKKSLKLCADCINKTEQIIIYPSGDKVKPITSYPVRCYKCRKIHNSRNKIYKIKKLGIPK